ncbi:hypothetical protein DOY81_009010 [Sarcophaga bullata]|nr:hypothetical protein DOY81_009010 [Sarcophaga bullata]
MDERLVVCSVDQGHTKRFYLIKANHRSLEERFFVDNVQTLEECIDMAVQYKGLALNYAPRERFKHLFRESKISRDHFWNQPQLYFNCHILRCPENTTMKTLVNDNSFNYYSMYRPPLASTHYVCLPEVGLFLLQTMPETFENASWNCRFAHNFCGSLPHVATSMRTNALTQLLIQHNNDERIIQPKV